MMMNDYLTQSNFLDFAIRKLPTDTFFLVVGAMDGIRHDGLYPYVSTHPEWHGVMVEPVKDQFEKLKINFEGFNNIQFENSAVTEKTGLAEITRIPMHLVGNVLPDWADGISTLKSDARLPINRFTEYCVKEMVNTISIEDLIKKYDINKIDLLQIDCEGYDFEIFEGIWKNQFRPTVLKVEIVHLTNQQKYYVLELLRNSNYTSTVVGDDVVAFR